MLIDGRIVTNIKQAIINPVVTRMNNINKDFNLALPVMTFLPIKV
jgi:hypothetical protein